MPDSAEAHARLASCNLLSAALKLVDLQTAEGDATEEDDGEAGSEEGLHILGEGLVDTGGDCREGEREREGGRESARQCEMETELHGKCLFMCVRVLWQFKQMIVVWHLVIGWSWCSFLRISSVRQHG